MKVLVTGACGQVGSRLIRQLLERSYDVKGLILPNDPLRRRIEGLKVEVVEGNLMDPAVALRLVTDVDAVIHTANLVSPLPGMSESDFFDNNVRGTLHLVKAASKRADALERFVHISSSAVYPDDVDVIAPCYLPIDEQHPLRPIGVYALSKMATEEIIKAHARETGLRTAMLRPEGICSGEGILWWWTVGYVCNLLKSGQAHPRGTLYMKDGTELWHELERAAQSKDQLCAITDMDGRPWMHHPADARDVAHACICALESPAAVGEAFNVVCPRPVSFPEAAQTISEATGQSVLAWKVPVRFVIHDDLSKAKTLIGYSPRWGIEEMVRSAIEVRKGKSDGMT